MFDACVKSFERLLWSVVVALACFTCGYMAVSAWNQWDNFPIITSVETAGTTPSFLNKRRA